jgi:hypothetical protein
MEHLRRNELWSLMTSISGNRIGLLARSTPTIRWSLAKAAATAMPILPAALVISTTGFSMEASISTVLQVRPIWHV